jgi:hypothetical protein
MADTGRSAPIVAVAALLFALPGVAGVVLALQRGLSGWWPALGAAGLVWCLVVLDGARRVYDDR